MGRAHPARAKRARVRLQLLAAVERAVRASELGCILWRRGGCKEAPALVCDAARGVPASGWGRDLNEELPPCVRGERNFAASERKEEEAVRDCRGWAGASVSGCMNLNQRLRKMRPWVVFLAQN